MAGGHRASRMSAVAGRIWWRIIWKRSALSWRRPRKWCPTNWSQEAASCTEVSSGVFVRAGASGLEVRGSGGARRGGSNQLVVDVCHHLRVGEEAGPLCRILSATWWRFYRTTPREGAAEVMSATMFETLAHSGGAGHVATVTSGAGKGVASGGMTVDGCVHGSGGGG